MRDAFAHEDMDDTETVAWPEAVSHSERCMQLAHESGTISH